MKRTTITIRELADEDRPLLRPWERWSYGVSVGDDDGGGAVYGYAESMTDALREVKRVARREQKRFGP